MITPSDSPSSPPDYAGVTPHGRGPAPYDIQAPMMDGEVTAAVSAAGSVAGAGIVYPAGPRQAATGTLLSSPQGYGDFDITAGFAGSDGETWPGDTSP